MKNRCVRCQKVIQGKTHGVAFSAFDRSKLVLRDGKKVVPLELQGSMPPYQHMHRECLLFSESPLGTR